MALRKITGMLLLACLLAPGCLLGPGAQAQDYAQMDKLSLEALTAPPAGGSGGGYAPARRRAARGYHYRSSRAYRPRAHRYGTSQAYRRRAYPFRALRAYGRHPSRHYGYAVHRSYGTSSRHGRFRSGSMPGLHAHHAAQRLPAFTPSHMGRTRHRR